MYLFLNVFVNFVTILQCFMKYYESEDVDHEKHYSLYKMNLYCHFLGGVLCCTFFCI